MSERSHIAPASLAPAAPTSSLAPWREEVRAMLALGLPIAASHFCQILINAIDVAMLGRVGPEAIAAGALGFAVFLVVLIFMLGLAMGTAPMMAQAIGRKRKSMRDVRRTLRQGIWATTAIGIPFAVASIWAEELLLLSGQEAGIAHNAALYVQALVPSLFFATWFTVLRNFAASYQRATPPMVIMVIGLIANTAFSYTLIFGKFGFPALGVIGAGIGASMAQLLMVSLLLAFVLLDRRFRRFHVLGRFWRADWHRFREVLRLGAPIGFAMLFEVALFAGSAFIMGLIGTLELAAHQIALQIASATFMIPMGIAQAAGIRVALFAGAADRMGVHRTGVTSVALGVGFMAVMAVLIWSVPQLLVSPFLPDAETGDNARVMALACSYLAFAAAFQIFDAAQVVGANLLRGLKDTRVPMIFAGIGYWLIGLPAGVLFAFTFGMGGAGVWLGFVVALIVAAALMLGRFTLRERVPSLRAALDGRLA
jgi:MATE family multidrug resistance protein